MKEKIRLLPVVLFLTFAEKCKLKIYLITMSRKLYRSNRNEISKTGRHITRTFLI
jgi:hypothetical protein